MTSPLEPVLVRFRGRLRRLPLLSFAAGFRHSAEDAGRILETLTHGLPEPASDPPHNQTAQPSPDVGEGGGGEGSERSTSNVNVPEGNTPNVQRRRCGDDVDESIQDAEALAAMLARELSDADNLPAFRKLVREHPRTRLLEALRRTQGIAPERIRRNPAAVFTGIAKRLAAEDMIPPTP